MSAEKTVNAILKNIKETFNGLEDDAVKEFYNIMIKEVRALADAVRKDALAQAQAQTQSTGSEIQMKQPRPKRVTNYTLFGNWFREQNTDIPAKEMFKNIGQAWGKLSKDERDEWKVKADEQNEKYREEYIEKYGSLPQKGKVRRKARTTNAFQQYVADFRKDNPTVNPKNVFTEAAAKWHKMTDKGKKKYEDRANKLKEEYKQEWEQMKVDNPQLIEQASGRKNKKSNENVPKPKLKTGYILFGEHWRSKLNKDTKTGKEAMSAIGASWQKLSQKEKEKFNKKSSTDNEKVTQVFVKENPDVKWTLSYNKRQEKASS